MRKCLPEIKKEISRQGSPKPAEKVLQIREEKIQNQAANEKALTPKLSEEGLRYNLGCMARLPSTRGEGPQSYLEEWKDAGAFLFYRLSTLSAERTCRLGLR